MLLGEQVAQNHIFLEEGDIRFVRLLILLFPLRLIAVGIPPILHPRTGLITPYSLKTGPSRASKQCGIEM